MSYIDIMRPETGVELPHDESTVNKIKNIVDPFILTDAQESRVMDVLQSEMWMGLSRDPERRRLTSLQMENTYVRELLNGEEDGDFLALDLGGTNFRVLFCKMRGGKCESLSRNYNVPTPKLFGPSADVFDHLAESILKFLTEENLLDHKAIPLGFTFSFPMVQESVKIGILVTWTKSFACPDGVGEDAVKMLEDALKRKKVTQVDVVAVLNDTTGTLLAGSYLNKQCKIGLIMGTGCNAAYVEKIENVDKWTGEVDGERTVVIDIEWGAFGDNGSLDFTKTEFDPIIDAHSNWVGSFTFEKLFAGHYIGDLARLALLKLNKEGLIFNSDARGILEKWKVFTAGHLSKICKDTSDNESETEAVLQELGLSGDDPKSDRAVVRYLCSALTIRATQYICCAVAVLVKHLQEPHMVVAIDGSLYRYHPKLHDMMTAKMAELVPQSKTEFILAEDGSGRGAAFVAAVVERMRTKPT